MEEPFLRSNSREHPGVIIDPPFVAGDKGIEIGEHLEQVGKIRVVLVEQIVDFRVAQQHDLDVDVDGFRLQRSPPGNDRLRRNNLQQPRPQGPHQHPPGARFTKQVAGFDNQVSAVGAKEAIRYAPAGDR